MKLKYESEMGDLDECPPEKVDAESMEAFRFVHTDSNAVNSFKPNALLSPKRRLAPKEQCLAWGLSLFNSKEKARQRLELLKRGNKNITKNIGGSIAVGHITEKDGLCTKAGKNGHFTLFEYENPPDSLNEKFELCDAEDHEAGEASR